jgi:hypothetical protein
MKITPKFTKKVLTIRELLAKRELNEINTSLAMQREEVWNKELKESLIDSLAHGYSINAQHAVIDNNVWYIIDSKQRTTTIYHYMDGTFIPEDQTILEFNNEYTCLDTETRESFLDYPLDFTIHNVPRSQWDILFEKLNKGKKLNAMQVARGTYSEKLENIQSVINHKFFSFSDFFSKWNRTQRENTILFAIAIMGQHTTESEDVIAYFKSLEINDDLVNNLAGKLNTLLASYSLYLEDKKSLSYLKRTIKISHLPTIIACVDQFGDIDDIGNFLVDFFGQSRQDKNDQRRAYDKTTSEDTSSIISINTRVDIIKKVLSGIGTQFVSTKKIKEPVKTVEEPVKTVEEPVKTVEEPVKTVEEPVKTFEFKDKKSGKTFLFGISGNLLVNNCHADQVTFNKASMVYSNKNR